MLFNTFEFLFFFIAIVIVYFLLQQKFRWVWLLVASYYFYFSWEPKLVLLLLASTLLDYFCSLKIYNSQSQRTKKAYLFASIFVNLSLLIFFKYLGFFTENTLQILQFFGIEFANAEQFKNTQQFSRILIPIGISFYTFQTLGYSIEVYRKNIQPEKHFGRYALYVSFFPQLVAGPIERAQNFLPQLKKKLVLSVESVRIGLVLMAWGFFMKMVVADRLGIYVDKVFGAPEQFPGIPLIIGAYFFTFQIYFDFAAYSIIAIGAARVMGFSLMTNFNRPLFSKDANEFWRRWHISLMSWLRDYLYRPLVKSAHLKRYWALFIVFVLSGLWHGASWNFVIWGGINGLFLLFEIGTREIRKKWVIQLSKFIHPLFFQFAWWFTAFHFVVFSLVFFRAPNLAAVYIYFRNIPRIHHLNLSALVDPFELWLSFFLIILVQIVHYFKRDDRVYELIFNRNSMVRWSVYLMFIFVIVFFSAVRKNPFIYFQF